MRQTVRTHDCDTGFQPVRGPLARAKRPCHIVTVLILALVTPSFAVDFTTQIKPILAENCYNCHGGSARKSGLRLDYRDAALKGGELSEKVIVPGKSGESELIRRVTSTDDNEVMPPKGDRLSAQEVALLKEWIDAGAPWPTETMPAITETEPDPVFTPQQKSHWVFQPVSKPAIPQVNDGQWPRGEIDRFILSRLEEKGLAPAPAAQKLDLIRRLAFDLTGLPPTPAEIDAFVQDDSPQAYEKLVDSYLASPRYGERFGQLWLDLVRFAESEGFEYDTPIGSLWKYRDYVIQSLNEDKPYDRFVREQVAGDEINPNDPTHLIAAGFHRLGAVRRNKGNQDVASSRNEVLTERTDIIGAAFMGLTMGCARCHDHKFDAISHKDYYRLQAFMAATDELDVPLASPAEQQAWQEQTREIRRQIAPLNRQLAAAPEGAERLRIKEQIEKLEDSLPDPLPGINTITNISEPTRIHVLTRGEWNRKKDAVGMRTPSIFPSSGIADLPLETKNPRTILANWLTDPANPLTARVMVNRIWQHHFGVGIVKTSNDFGINGDRPSHPKLLDYLADAFVTSGWSIKSVHRMILLSNTYRQSSSSSLAAGMETDPDNRLLWKFPRRRLTAEELRDSMLAVSGRINLKMGGPSVFLPVDPELPRQLYKPQQWAVTKDLPEHDRRSIYLVAKRNLRLPSMEVFDQPALGNSCPRRETSTHAPQALELLNGTMSNDLAMSLATRLQAQAGGDPAKQVELAFRLVAGRSPSDQEMKVAVDYLRQGSLKEFSLAMFNLNAFLYLN